MHGPSFVVYSSGTSRCQRATDALKDRKGVLWQEVLIFLPLPLSGVGEGGGGAILRIRKLYPFDAVSV